MTLKRELLEQQLSRFHRIASRVPLPNDLNRDQYGDTFADAVCLVGSRLKGKIITLFSPLSDDEMVVACQVMIDDVTSDKTGIWTDRVAFWLADQIQVTRTAEVIAILAPTFLRIASSDTSMERTFSIVLNADRDNRNTPARQWWMHSFPEKRVNWLHGHLMYAASSEKFNPAHAEWFGANRERIMPLWELLLKDETFEPERVEVLLENAGRGAMSVLGGAL